MAESRRRGKDPVDDNVDGDVQDAADETFDDDSAESTGERRSAVDSTADSRGGTATKTRARASEAKAAGGTRTRTEDRQGPWARLVRFIREIAAELRKVIWPTRNELVTYTSVVVVFVAVIVAIVAGLDAGFSWGALHVFGK